MLLRWDVLVANLYCIININRNMRKVYLRSSVYLLLHFELCIVCVSRLLNHTICICWLLCYVSVFFVFVCFCLVFLLLLTMLFCFLAILKYIVSCGTIIVNVTISCHLMLLYWTVIVAIVLFHQTDIIKNNKCSFSYLQQVLRRLLLTSDLVKTCV